MSYISPSTVAVAPVTRKKLFLLYKTCEMQIFRPQIIIVLNFNQKTENTACKVEYQLYNQSHSQLTAGVFHSFIKTLLDKTCQVLRVLDFFYTRRHPAPVPVPIPQSLRDTSTSSVVTKMQIFRLQIIMPDFEVETRRHTTNSSI